MPFRTQLTVLATTALAIAAGAYALTTQPQQPPAAPDFGQMLVDGLQSTEGCLGVEVAQMGISERNTIIAWFENKQAALNWYNHPTHQFMMRASGNNRADITPLEHIDDDTPIMVMASILMAGPNRPPANPDNPMMPIHSISIELYTPLPGGAMLNGRLAPLDFPVKHMDGAPEPAPRRSSSPADNNNAR